MKMTYFRKFLVLRVTFTKFCKHIYKGFGVKENDAAVRFSLSITILESNFSNPSKKKRDLSFICKLSINLFFSYVCTSPYDGTLSASIYV